MRLSVSSRGIAVGLGIVACVYSSPVGAQSGVEVAATVGVYVPSSSPFQLSAGSAVTSMYGVAARLWFSPKIGLQLDAGTTSPVTYGPFYNPGGSIMGGTGQVRAMTAQALFMIAGEPGGSHLWLSAGAGATQHSGSAYAATGNPTTLAGALGLAGAVHIASGLNLQGGATTLIYGMNVYDREGSFGYSAQYDLLGTVGMSWHFQ